MREILTGHVKRLENFDEFNDVFQSYSSFPYFEEWEIEAVRKEYEFTLKNGYAFGCYYEGKCVGLITLVPAKFYEHPIKFKDTESVMYISNLVVLFDYRYHSFGSTLAKFSVEFAKKQGYKTIYFRFRESHEFGKHIAQGLGFSVNYDAYQEVTRPRTRNYNAGGQYGDTDVRLFMVKQL